MTTRTLLKGGTVLSLDRQVGNFEQGDVLIEGGRIVEVGTGLRARDAEIIEADGTIVMPGFVDTHRHLWMSLFRNLGHTVPGRDELSRLLSPDDVYAATLVGLLGAIEAGITTVVDWSDTGHNAESADAALQAHADSGIRGIFVYPPAGEVRGDGAPEETLRGLIEATSAETTTLAYGAPDVVRANVERFPAAVRRARENGLRVHAHAGRHAADHGLLVDLAEHGLLGSDVTLVHCFQLGAADLDTIAASSTAVALTPSSDMAAGNGSPPVQEFIDRGIRPGLGIDQEALAPGDMFAQMRAAISVQHATYFDLKLAGKAGLPNLLNTREVIRYATVDGARVAGVGEVAGTLTPGRQADLIVLRTDRPNIHPVNDPIGAVVWGMDTSNVDWVFVSGRPLVANGVLTADVQKAAGLAVAARQRLAGPLVEQGSEVAR